eukprot:scaffold288355_cov146-Cyclotella_meneghiniana.AAC.1
MPDEFSDEALVTSATNTHYTEHVFINDALIRQVQRMTLNSVISWRDNICVYNVNEVLFPTDEDLELLEQQKNENLPMKDDGAFQYDGLIE